MRNKDPFGIMPSKEIKVDKASVSSVSGALLQAESLLASIYGVQV